MMGTDDSERQQLEAKILCAKQEWERTFDSVPDLIAIIDRNHRIRRVNRPMAERLGLTPEQCIGLSCHESVHGLLAPPPSCPHSRTMADGKVHMVEIREERLGGDFLVSTTPLYDECGTLTASVHVAREITERKRMEEALRLSRDRLEERVGERTAELLQAYQLLDSIFENTHILIAYLDREFTLLRVNRAYAQADGREPWSYVGQNHFTLFPNEENERIFRQVVATGTPYFIKAKPFVYAEHPERGVTYWDWSLIPIKDSEGRVVNLVFTLLNVTELKRSEEFVRTILDAVDEGFAVIDQDYRIITANRAFLALSSRTLQEEVVGEHCYQVLHHCDLPCSQVGEECAVKRTRESGEPCTTLHIHSGVDGRHAMCAETKAFPLPDQDGRISKVIYVVNDISERVKLEDQLRHAQKMEAIGTLAGGIAHDFNNIINVIHGFASLMEEEMGADHPLLPHLREIMAASDRATQLTRGLLSMSRKQSADFKPVNINEIVEGMQKMILRIVGQEIRLETALADTPLLALADSAQISQVLMNLATNAKDVMAEGGVLRLETRYGEMDAAFIRGHGFGRTGSYAVIAVSDTGSGMEEETRKRVFEPYFTTKGIGKGTGLGLSIVHGIIDQHQGYIDCESKPGQGTTFTAYLPLLT